MRVAGIIAEYNPFHSGHRYHIHRTRELTGADMVIVIMSGDFVQRGEPAVTDKYARTAMALSQGADAVLELPLSWATGTAQRFARGGVSILHRLGPVTDLVWGSEDPDSPLWEPLTRLFTGNDSPPSPEQAFFRAHLQAALKQGLTYPAARAAAAEAVLPGSAALLAKPNNILALEYRMAIAGTPGCRIAPREIRRVGSSYHEEALPAPAAAGTSAASPEDPGRRDHFPEDPGYASASALRRRLLAGADPRELSDWIPEDCLSRLGYAMGPDDLSSLLHYRLLTAELSELAACQDMNEDLANRLTHLSRQHPDHSFSQLAEALKTRNITRTRANRALLHCLLQLKEEAAEPAAVRLLGFRNNGLLRPVMDSTRIPIVTKPADAPAGVFDADVRASRLYRRLVWDRYGILLKDEFRRGPVILD